jgi:hypothetical protein
MSECEATWTVNVAISRAAQHLAIPARAEVMMPGVPF